MSGTGRGGLAKIETRTKTDDEVCHDDSATPVKAQTIDELHSLQIKKSAPSTPIQGGSAGTGRSSFDSVSDQDHRNKQQLQSIRLINFYVYCYNSQVLINTTFVLRKFKYSRTPMLKFTVCNLWLCQVTSSPKLEGVRSWVYQDHI